MKMKHERGKKKLLTIAVLSISILFSLLTIQNEAVNQTSNTSNKNTQTSSNTKTNTNTSNTGKTNNTTNTNTTTTGKSSNANLSNLGIKPYDFSGFKAATTSYKVTVPESTETIEVYAKAQETKATVTGTGKKKLEKGENKIEVVVTAEDGTKKTYTINITRGTQKEGTTNTGETNVANGNGLSELSINGSTLSPDFQTNVYQYTTEYVGKDTKLNIGTVPTSEDYIVEIMGNENLKEGRNIITIAVSQKGGESIATYQITVNKSLVDEQEESGTSSTIIGIVIAVVILVAIVGFFVLRKKGSKNIAKDFSGVSLYKKHAREEKDKEVSKPSKKEETHNTITIPRPETNDTTMPRPEINDTTTMPRQETNDTTAMPRQETNDTTTIPRQEANDTTTIPKQETYDSTMIPKEEIQETTVMPKEEYNYKEGETEEIEKTSKEELKEKFLNNYSNYEEDYEDASKEARRRAKHKGKRFK